MKNILFILLVFCTLSLFSQETKVDSKIEKVTVFQSGAQVFRTANTSLKQGYQLLVFSNLSNVINPNSLQLSGKGKFTIMSVTHQDNYLEEIKQSKNIKSLQDSIKLLTHQHNYNQQMYTAYQEEMDLLKANRDLGSANSATKTADIKAAAEYYRVQFRSILADRLRLTEENAEIQNQLQRLNQELNQLSGSIQPKMVGEVLVEIDASEAGAAQFDLSYMVYNAGWTPIYDLRSENAKDPIELHYRANIFQDSGEDWNKVKLAVNTGNPRNNTQAPTPYPWYLSIGNQYIDKMRVISSSNAPVAYSSEAKVLEMEGDMALNSANFVSVSEGQTSTTYQIDLPYSIPSTNKVVSVKVSKWSLPATYRYFAAPRYDEKAYLMARITGWQELNLVEGKVNVFFEGTMVGSSYINPNTTLDTLNIFLGSDPGVVIKRTKSKDKNSIRILGSNRKVNIAWDIDVRNNKSSDIKILLQDQIPLSNQKDMEVSLLNYSGAKYDDKTGFITWEFDLASKQIKKLSLEFEVKYPKDWTIQNLW